MLAQMRVHPQAELSIVLVSLAKGEQKSVSQSVKDPESGKDVQSVLLTPKAIFKEPPVPAWGLPHFAS